MLNSWSHLSVSTDLALFFFALLLVMKLLRTDKLLKSSLTCWSTYLRWMWKGQCTEHKNFSFKLGRTTYFGPFSSCMLYISHPAWHLLCCTYVSKQNGVQAGINEWHIPVCSVQLVPQFLWGFGHDACADNMQASFRDVGQDHSHQRTRGQGQVFLK